MGMHRDDLSLEEITKSLKVDFYLHATDALADICKDILVQPYRLLPFPRFNEGLNPPAIPACLLYPQLQDRVLVHNGCCHSLHNMDRLQFHIRLHTRSSLLDQGAIQMHRSVRYVVHERRH